MFRNWFFGFGYYLEFVFWDFRNASGKESRFFLNQLALIFRLPLGNHLIMLTASVLDGTKNSVLWPTVSVCISNVVIRFTQ